MGKSMIEVHLGNSEENLFAAAECQYWRAIFEKEYEIKSAIGRMSEESKKYGQKALQHIESAKESLYRGEIAQCQKEYSRSCELWSMTQFL